MSTKCSSTRCWTILYVVSYTREWLCERCPFWASPPTPTEMTNDGDDEESFITLSPCDKLAVKIWSVVLKHDPRRWEGRGRGAFFIPAHQMSAPLDLLNMDPLPYSSYYRICHSHFFNIIKCSSLSQRIMMWTVLFCTDTLFLWDKLAAKFEVSCLNTINASGEEGGGGEGCIFHSCSSNVCRSRSPKSGRPPF